MKNFYMIKIRIFEEKFNNILYRLSVCMHRKSTKLVLINRFYSFYKGNLKIFYYKINVLKEQFEN